MQMYRVVQKSKRKSHNVISASILTRCYCAISVRLSVYPGTRSRWCCQGWVYWPTSSAVSWTWASTPRSTLTQLVFTDKMTAWAAEYQNIWHSQFTTRVHINRDRGGLRKCGSQSGIGWSLHGERAECEPIAGVYGLSPTGVQGQSQEAGAKPPEAERLLALKRPMEAAN